MRSVRRSLRGNFWKRVITYVLVWCLIMNTSVPTVLALGLGDVIGDNGLVGNGVNGNAAPIWGPGTILETANGAVIDWNNFNTVGGETVTFNQYDALGGSLSAASAVLNRITSVSATQFDGTLNGNGRVFVVNPAGVVFGAGSQVNVNQLIVSGLSMINFDDVATTGALPRFEGGGGDVSNRAVIRADDSVYLVGKQIYTNGSIIAPNGYVILAAGEKVYLVQDGSNIAVDIQFETNAGDYYGAAPAPDVKNSSLIYGDTIVLAAGDAFSRAIHNTGVLTGDTIKARAAKIRNAQFINVNANAFANADGGTVTLEGTEEILMNLDYGGVPGYISANGGLNGDGGTITLTTEGTITMVDGTYINARGGGTSGDGGQVKLTCEHFVIDGDIDASPQNAANANGTLTIDPPAGVTIVDETVAVPGTPDTIHTGDIEALSTTGTNLIVHVGDGGVTVKDLVDGIIGGRGDIEFITGSGGAITFEDPSDTISTTRGNIGFSAGSGGIVAGSLETGDPGFVPGQINVETALGSGGSVTVENLTVREGQNSGQINVKADGQLTVNGTVAVGSTNPIDNNVSGGNVEAKVKLESGDDTVLNGGVTAESHATSSGDPTSSVQLFVGVEPGSLNHGTAGDLDVLGGDLVATAQADAGTSYALVEVDTHGTNEWNGHQALATADVAHVEGTETKDQVDGSDKAELIITEQGILPELTGVPDIADTHMDDPVTIDVLANDEDATGAALDTGPTHGTVVQNPDGTFTYTPEAGYVGDDSFTYTATDGVDTTGPVTVTITMNNNPPVPGADSANTHWDQAVGGNVLANDTDADSDSLNVVLDGTAPTHGTVVLNPDGTFTYTPTDTGYVGTDQFTYEVTDGQLDGLGDPVVQTGTVTITFENNLPGVVPDAVDTHMDQAVGGNVLANDTDADLDALSVVLDGTAPTHGTVVLNTDGSFTYTPTDTGYVGTDQFTYEVTDGQLDGLGDPVVQTGTVTVNLGNNLPNAVPDVANTHMDQAVGGNVLANDTDADLDPLSVVLDGTAPTHGTVVLNPDGSFTYTPTEAGYVGPDTFTYEVTDGQLDAGNPVVVTGTVTVNIGNNLPVANNDEATTITGNPVSGNVLTNDLDLDGDPLVVVLDGTAPTNGTVTLNVDGSFTYEPNPGFVGDDTFTYEISDGQGGTGGPIGAMVTICVEAAPAPSISPVAPGLERQVIDYSGCPALVKWVAKELGIDEDKIDIWMPDALASSRDIQPFETYARLRTAAVILKDNTGAHVNALTQVINEFASSTAPPTEEQMASIADAIASNAGADNQYGIAEEYLNALAQYISILNSEMGFSMEEAVEFATTNYVDQLAERGNANVVAYVMAKLAEL